MHIHSKTILGHSSFNYILVTLRTRVALKKALYTIHTAPSLLSPHPMWYRPVSCLTIVSQV